jgi:hypothetical protein
MTRKSKGLVAIRMESEWADVKIISNIFELRLILVTEFRKSTLHTHGLDSEIVSLGTLGTLLKEKKYYEKVTIPIQWPYPVGLS